MDEVVDEDAAITGDVVADGLGGDEFWNTPAHAPTDTEIPAELALIPVDAAVLFPTATLSVRLNHPSCIAAVEDALTAQQAVAVVARRSPGTPTQPPDGENYAGVQGSQPCPVAELHPVCTAARILKLLRHPDGSAQILVHGLRRVRLQEEKNADRYRVAAVALIEETIRDDDALRAWQARVARSFAQWSQTGGTGVDGLPTLTATQSPSVLADAIAARLEVTVEEQLRLLEICDVEDRLRQIDAILHREIHLLELGQKLQNEIQSELEVSQRDFYLRQQLRAIHKELGEDDPRQADILDLRARIDAANLPVAARGSAERELDRLARIPAESAEHSVVRSYLEWMADLPWSIRTEDNLDLAHAERVLDEDHTGLQPVKDRILEFLAVRRLRQCPRGPILCLVGPPGVGKTSLGRSVARAMGRRFQRLSLGGLRDEAEVRGHRRTYVGAIPGRITQGLKSAGANNPLFMLDEIDKVGNDFRGDPASALLEVLDPEQNCAFQDHYLDVPFDMSATLFIATANSLDPIPHALRDRLEVLEISGYCEEEKVQIARRHLVPKQLVENGLENLSVSFTDEALQRLIHDYTHEAGLRELERTIASICRKIARARIQTVSGSTVVSQDSVPGYLGAARFVPELAGEKLSPGVAIGLAWTAAGGSILFVEAATMPGGKDLSLTGQLGDVMKESAQAALTFLRGRAADYGLDTDFFRHNDIHLHVPAAGIPKDGPSAGAPIAVALASVLSGRPVRDAVAMTGEITLRGAVLAVGGIKEKLLAARRAGVREVLLPARNARDVEEVDAGLLHGLELRYVHTVDELLDAALETPSNSLQKNVSTATIHADTLPGPSA